MEDLGVLKYFMRIEVARNSQGFYLSQRKYVLNILTETDSSAQNPLLFPWNKTINSRRLIVCFILIKLSIVGWLVELYISGCDEAKLSYSVHTWLSILRTHMHDHWDACLRVVRVI